MAKGSGAARAVIGYYDNDPAGDRMVGQPKCFMMIPTIEMTPAIPPY
jgi:hypothetical protein